GYRLPRNSSVARRPQRPVGDMMRSPCETHAKAILGTREAAANRRMGFTASRLPLQTFTEPRRVASQHPAPYTRPGERTIRAGDNQALRRHACWRAHEAAKYPRPNFKERIKGIP